MNPTKMSNELSEDSEKNDAICQMFIGMKVWDGKEILMKGNINEDEEEEEDESDIESDDDFLEAEPPVKKSKIPTIAYAYECDSESESDEEEEEDEFEYDDDEEKVEEPKKKIPNCKPIITVIKMNNQEEDEIPTRKDDDECEYCGWTCDYPECHFMFKMLLDEPCKWITYHYNVYLDGENEQIVYTSKTDPTKKYTFDF